MPSLDALTALVVGGTSFGDADRIVHVLTRNGRMSLFAHGARKSRRRFAGALEAFATVTCTLSPRQKSGMPTMLDASVVSARLPIREDLGKIALASYFVEVSGRVAPEDSPADGLFELTTAALDRLTIAAATHPLRVAFEVRLLDFLGYRPDLERCARCGESNATYFDLSQGGLLCAPHGGPQEGQALAETLRLEGQRPRSARAIGPKTLEWLRGVAGAEALTDDPGLGDEWCNRASRATAPATTAFFRTLLATPLRSERMLLDLGL